jgi:negative regulator of sigma E activity
MKELDEKLSLLLDDYCDEDIDAVLDEVSKDVNQQYRMRRYRMIGEVMRHELPAAIDTDFHHSVMAGIRDQVQSSNPTETEPVAPAVAPAFAARSWFRPFAGAAVAASVALVTIVLWQPLQDTGEPQDGGLASVDQQKIQQLGQQLQGNAVQAGMRWKLENESAVLQQKLNAYLVNHTEYSNSMQGLIPQARVAGFDAQQQ